MFSSTPIIDDVVTDFCDIKAFPSDDVRFKVRIDQCNDGEEGEVLHIHGGSRRGNKQDSQFLLPLSLLLLSLYAMYQ